jgi:tRNA (guanine37-N1)-methyltransferase
VTRFTVVSILPEVVDGALALGVIGRARAGGALAIAFVNPRDFTHDRHRTVDDTPYGGGPGMVMKCEPLVAAIEAACGDAPGHRVLLTPGGAPLTQARVRALAARDHVVLVCGRYAGIDERVLETSIDEELSLGDFVLTGGELGAAAVIDAVARLMPGVLGDAASADDESFSAGLLEYPHYTRPADLGGRPVPAVLAGGNHEAIRKWRRQQALRRTARRRPDLFARVRLDKADDKLLAGAPELDVAARTAIALVHHPVHDRTGKVVTSAVTNLDVHDLARSAATYGLGRCFIVTPVASQRDKAAHIARLWMEQEGGDHRADALRLTEAVPGVAEAIAALTEAHGQAPLIAATSAVPGRWPHARVVTPGELVGELQGAPGRPLLVLFGTGWGLADDLMPMVERVITPINGRPAWNHLSVRSAVAIILDRLFGLRDS